MRLRPAPVMAAHKFAVGQIVELDRRSTPNSRQGGRYEVVRVLPGEQAGSWTYRVKSDSEPFERNAAEYEVAAVRLSAPDQAAAAFALRPRR